MKAIRLTRYGTPDTLAFTEMEKPIPKDHQVLIQVYAASVNALDGHSLRGKPLVVRMGTGLLKPKDPRLGVDVAGRVEAVGKTVTQFQPGDEVFGLGVGTFAEYAVAREDKLALKPANLSFEEAAAVPVGALTALLSLRDKGQVQAGQQVLIHGAGGAVGTFTVQLAKVFGAEVTAVCGPRNVDLIRSLGADHVIDYTQEDVTRTQQQYDLILAVNGYHSIFAYRRLLRPTGTFVMVGATKERLLPTLLQTALLGPVLAKKGQRMSVLTATPTQEHLLLLKELLEAGKIAPAIDKRYPLHEVPEAIRSLEEGHARGKVVITVHQSGTGG